MRIIFFALGILLLNGCEQRSEVNTPGDMKAQQEKSKKHFDGMTYAQPEVVERSYTPSDPKENASNADVKKAKR